MLCPGATRSVRHTFPLRTRPLRVSLPFSRCCSQDSDLPTLVSSLCHGGHLVMPEHQSRCEFQRGGVDLGLGAAGEVPGDSSSVGEARLPTQCLRSALSESGCCHPQQPWQAAREASEEVGGGEAGFSPLGGGSV